MKQSTRILTTELPRFDEELRDDWFYIYPTHNRGQIKARTRAVRKFKKKAQALEWISSNQTDKEYSIASRTDEPDREALDLRSFEI